MAYERRGRSEYYYRKHREGSRVVSVYFGRGPIAEWLDHHQRLKKAWQAHRERDGPHGAADAIPALEEHHALARDVKTACLLVAGFKQHKREWRRARQGRPRKEPARTTMTLPTMELQDLVGSATAGADDERGPVHPGAAADAEAVQRLREATQAVDPERPTPDRVAAVQQALQHEGVWREQKRLFRYSLQQILRVLPDQMREALMRDVYERMIELGWPDASPAERMLIEQAVLREADTCRLWQLQEKLTWHDQDLELGQRASRLLRDAEDSQGRSLVDLMRVRDLIDRAPVKVTYVQRTDAASGVQDRAVIVEGHPDDLSLDVPPDDGHDDDRTIEALGVRASRPDGRHEGAHPAGTAQQEPRLPQEIVLSPSMEDDDVQPQHPRAGRAGTPSRNP